MTEMYDWKKGNVAAMPWLAVGVAKGGHWGGQTGEWGEAKVGVWLYSWGVGGGRGEGKGVKSLWEWEEKM